MPRDMELGWARSHEEVLAQDAMILTWISHYGRQHREYARRRVQMLRESPPLAQGPP